MNRRDALLPLTAAVLFGAGAPVAKALAEGGGAQMFAGVLYLGSGLGLAVARLARRSPEEPLRRRDLGWLAASMASGGALAPFLLVWGLQRTSGSVASLLLNVEVIFTALLAWTIYGEHRHARTVAGLALIVAGGVVLSIPAAGATAGSTWMGSLAVVGACALWAVDNNVTQKISMRDPLQIAMWKGLVAGGANVVLALLLGQRLPDGSRLVGGLGLGLVSYGASLALFVVSLRRIGTARTSSLFAVAPFVGVVVAVVFWKEPVTWAFTGCGLLMAAGVALQMSARHTHCHRHEPLEHAHLHEHDEHHRHDHAPGGPPGEPHSHGHRHEPIEHEHPHEPDIHHRHGHE